MDGWLSPFTVHLKLSLHLFISCTPIQYSKYEKRNTDLKERQIIRLLAAARKLVQDLTSELG